MVVNLTGLRYARNLIKRYFEYIWKGSLQKKISICVLEDQLEKCKQVPFNWPTRRANT